MRSVPELLEIVLTIVPLFFSVCPGETVTLPGGQFLMGDSLGDADESPVRKVMLSSFSISVFEVTEADYAACVGTGACSPAHYDDSTCRAWNGNRFIRVVVPAESRDPGFPVVCVTWHQARSYCGWKGMRLPSEAEWEYAARGGKDSRFPWEGPGPPPGRCVIARSKGPERVGTCSPNGWGVHDMTGNAWEWTGDHYDSKGYGSDTSVNPEGPRAGLYRVIRGGGWYSRSDQVRIANRLWFSPDFAEVSIGFRCATSTHK